jgi:FkbM family methyltransferase
MTLSIPREESNFMTTLFHRAGIPLLAAYLRTTPFSRGKRRLFRFAESVLSQAQGVGKRKVRTRHGFDIEVDLEGDMLGWHVYLSGTWEPQTSKLLASLIQPGDVVIDIGANIGYFTLLASTNVGPSGKVLAFEPIPSIRRDLERNLSLNRVNNVEVYPIALSHMAGTTTIHENKGLSSVRPIGDAKGTFVVETAPLDALLEDDLPVRVVKIDVEGAEGAVVEGMWRCIQKHKPDLVMEVTDGFLKELGYSAARLCGRLIETGYRMYKITPGGLRELTELPEQWRMQFNAFFTVRDSEDRILRRSDHEKRSAG